MDRSALEAELGDFFSSSDDDEAPERREPEPEPEPEQRPAAGAAPSAAAAAAASAASALPPPLSRGRGVPTLQRRCCEWLARNLGALDDLDDLPEHLSAQVIEAIEADRRLLEDDGLDVWLAAVVSSGATTALCLRWASGLTDAGMVALAGEEAWVSQLWRLDIAFCSNIGDRGLELIAAVAPQLSSLAISGCRAVTDRGIAAVGAMVHGLQTMEMEMLPKVSDFGVQSLVRGCPELEVLLLGGCSQLSNISTQLIVDHLAPSLRRLDLGGLPTMIDMDVEDLRKCTALQTLSVRACAKLTDRGVAHLATLCKRQAKIDLQQQRGGAAGGGESLLGGGCLVAIDLAGVVRMTDKGLGQFLTAATNLTFLDVSGCSGLTASGFVNAIGALPQEQRRRYKRLTMTGMEPVAQGAGLAAEMAAKERVIDWDRLQELLGPEATIVYK